MMLIAWSLISVWPAELAIKDVADGIAFLGNWIPPETSGIMVSVRASLITMATAFLGASFGLAIGLPCSLAASSKLGLFPFPVVTALRALFVVFRSLPEIVVALIFLVVFGPGAFAAMLAMSLHNTGVFAKLLSDRVDEASNGTFEALVSIGASRTTAAAFGMLPEIWPTVVAQYFYRLEVGVRASIALGLIGAGGIGQQLINHFKTFQYREVTTDVIVIMFLIGTVDFCSVRMQRKYVQQ